jgi:rubrerythrin
MPTFTDPFNQMTPERKMTERELIRALRLALAAEEDAISLYEAIVDTADNDLAEKVLQSIADEERVHVGELQRLIGIILSDEDERLADGAEEVDGMDDEGNNPGKASPKEAMAADLCSLADRLDREGRSDLADGVTVILAGMAGNLPHKLRRIS